jgi:hypothetical protein
MASHRPLVVLLLLLAAALGATIALQWPGPQIQVDPLPPPVHTNSPGRQAPTASVASQASADVTATNPGRIEDQPRQGTGSRLLQAVGPVSDGDAEQGIRARILAPGGRPLRGCSVYLLDNTVGDPRNFGSRRMLASAAEPAGEVVTDESGLVRIGVLHPGPKFVLRAASEEYAELEHGPFVVTADEWLDLGDLTLENGVIVSGRVLQASTGQPIADAEVSLSNPSLSYRMLATPGRERGLLCTTDEQGSFLFTNAPRSRLITLAAEAPGFAYAELPNLRTDPDFANQFEIRLEPGLPLGGRVVDERRVAIAGATIHATLDSGRPLQSAAATSDEDGWFQLPMQRPGSYRLAVSARGYEDRVLLQVEAGVTDLEVVLAGRGKILLRVLGSDGQPVDSYTASLRRNYPGRPQTLIRVPDYPDVTVRPDDVLTGYAQMRNVPAGQFVWVISTADYAKTQSEPFQIRDVNDSLTVEVQLTLGGSLQGVVLGADGNPLAGADVRTRRPRSEVDDASVPEVFRSMLPDTHTEASVPTDAEGRFRLERLSYGQYRLVVAHETHSDATISDLQIDPRKPDLDLGLIRMQAGTAVAGICLVDGRPSGQVEVLLSSAADSGNNSPGADATGTRPNVRLLARTISSQDGRFRLPRPMPAGDYTIEACQLDGAISKFQRVQQLDRTRRPLHIRPGQRQAELVFELSLK